MPILKVVKIEPKGIVTELKRIADSLDIIISEQYGIKRGVAASKAKEVEVSDVEAGVYQTDEERIELEEIAEKLKGLARKDPWEPDV